MDYAPSLLFRSGHLNTLYPSLFRKQIIPDYKRLQLETLDKDFLHVDMLKDNRNRIAVLCHGLEGSSTSNYIIGTGKLLAEQGWDIAAINYRGCSGVMNRQLRMYHSGATDDLDQVIQYLIGYYDEIALVGFSLGGNLVIKYCGERGSDLDSKIVACIAASVPLDLEAGSMHLGKSANWLYTMNFLKTLSQKVRAKHQQFPGKIDLRPMKHIKTVYDFDDAFTGPLHGFASAHDYYSQCSSKNFLNGLTIPTIIINALDDPFLPEECYPESYDLPSQVTAMTTKNGGHVGWVQSGKNYWMEEIVGRFLGEVV